MRVLAEGRIFLEGVRWHQNRFWASDAYAGKVIAVSLEGVVEEIVTVDDVISGLGWLPNGDLLIVSMFGDKILRFGKGGLVVHADLAGMIRGHPNDMIVDESGRAYVGTTGFDVHDGSPIQSGAVLCIDATGRVEIAAEDLLFPNGMVTLHSGRTLVVAESFAHRLTSFSIQTNGRLANRREWARFGDPPVSANLAEFLAGALLTPDGLAADRDGCIWVADPRGRRAVKVEESGRIVDERSVGGEYGVYSCAIGGGERVILAVGAASSHDPAVLRSRASSRLVAFELR
jgi:sugar lactone lactonase YvrE